MEPVVADRRRRPATPRVRKRWDEDPDLKGGVDCFLDPIIARLYAHRERRGWSQDQAASAAGIRAQTLRDIENRRCVPDIPTLIRLFFIYGEVPTLVAMAPRVQRSTVRDSGASSIHA